MQIDEPGQHQPAADVEHRVAVGREPGAHLRHEAVAHAHVERPAEPGARIHDLSAPQQHAHHTPPPASEEIP